MDRLIHDYMAITAFTDKALKTQEEIEYSCMIIAEVFGPSQLKAITSARAETFYTNLRKGGSIHRAAKVMKTFRSLLKRARGWDLMTKDPTLMINVVQAKPRKQKWTPEQANLIIQTAWGEGYKGAAVALAIAYDTGLSPVDIRTLTMGEIEGHYIITERTKTEIGGGLQIWPNTLKWISEYHRAIGVSPLPKALVIRTRRGRPFTKDTLAKDVRKVRRLAGIPDELKLSDLRRTATVEEQKAGATNAQIGSRRFWSPKTVEGNLKIYGVPDTESADGAFEKRPMNLKGPKV